MQDCDRYAVSVHTTPSILQVQRSSHDTVDSIKHYQPEALQAIPLNVPPGLKNTASTAKRLQCLQVQYLIRVDYLFFESTMPNPVRPFRAFPVKVLFCCE